MSLTKREIEQLVRTVREETARAKRAFRNTPPPRVYYFSHLLRDYEEWELRAKFGDLLLDNHFRHRDCYTDVRVGSHRSDQVQEGGLHDNSKEDESYDYISLPRGRGLDGLRHGLWRLTDARYREAVDGYLQRRSQALTYVNRHRGLPSFEERSPLVDIAWRRLPPVDVERWRRYVLGASTLPKRFARVMDSYIDLHVRHVTRVFVSSEGAVAVERLPFWKLECYLWLLSRDGDAVPWSNVHFVTDPAELPSLSQLRRELAGALARMNEVVSAPSLRAFAGPVLLDPVPAGLLLHEAVGHRLEGNRLLAAGEGHTFRDQMGARVLPAFLHVRDDPTLVRFGGRSLVGHYRFDDEGTRAESAEVITGGCLRGFLTTRTVVSRRHRSNGHARCRYHQRPTSRMAVTVVEAENGLSDAELKKALIAEIQRQRVPYGIHIVEAHTGETSTDSYNFQAFLGETRYAKRVFADGREEVIRGVDFVGTPLNAVGSIIAAGKRMEVDNSYCGAESGFIPVSTVSPSLLISHLELQSKAETPFTQFVYPLPWTSARKVGPARRARVARRKRRPRGRKASRGR